MFKYQAIRSAAARVRTRLPHAARPAILMYHRIASESFDPWRLAVSPDAFAEQLAWLARHRTVLRLAEFADLHRSRKLPRDAIALTFDDGYACNAEIAVPVLNNAGLPATIFIAADQFGRGGGFWWDELQQIIIEHGASSIMLDGKRIELGARQDADWHLATDRQAWSSRQHAFYRLWQRLRTLPSDQLDAAMSQLREQKTGEAVRQPHRLMTAAQTREIRSQEIEFGSHALSHASLPNLSPSERAREVRDSAKACETLTGTRPSTFAYPFGDYDEECEALVRDAGYECACTAEPHAVRRDSRLFALPRVQVGNWSSRMLARELHVL